MQCPVAVYFGLQPFLLQGGEKPDRFLKFTRKF